MKFLIIVFLLFPSLFFGQNLPIPSSGKVNRIIEFPSKYVTPRNVDVWLPENYSSKKKYAVLYMHDGQMLFDSTTTWNKQEWKVDEIATDLMNSNKTKDFIVVGIWNDGKNRHADYFPQKPYEKLTKKAKKFVFSALKKSGRTVKSFHPKSDAYLKFIVKELKPFIDQTYATNPSTENTCIAGSSMGGLISMYAICEYPTVFGAAACLSTHWPGTFEMENNPIPTAFYGYLSQNLPTPNNHKIYFDYGNKTLDVLYPPLQKEVDKIMIQKGFSADNWRTYFVDGADHSEKSWSARLAIPLEFMFKNLDGPN
jgi:predicted alpha/beta superfamily hydrolase